MPVDLPGYYFDEAKNRYFPRTKEPSEAVSQPKSSLRRDDGFQIPSKKRRVDVWSAVEQMRLGGSWSHRERAYRDIMCSHLEACSRVEHYNIIPLNSIASFCVAKLPDGTHGLVGDDQGCLYSYFSCDGPSRHASVRTVWRPEISSDNASPISSMSLSGTRCIATSFAPYCRIYVKDLTSSDCLLMIRIDKKLVHEVWSSHLQDRNLVIGANLKALYMNDIDSTRSPTLLDTMSDVFAVHQRQNLVYTGTRSGSITRFDLRVDPSHQLKLFDFDAQLLPASQRSPILHLSIVNEWQLLVSQLNGLLATYDLRFARSSDPVVTFRGHVNSHTRRLGITVDPRQNYVFAAGEDNRVRGWSLHTGQPLYPRNTSSNPDSMNPLFPQHPANVVTMQMTEEREGLCLWASSGNSLKKYWIEQRQGCNSPEDIVQCLAF